MQQLAGKIVLITGGESGIGLASARLFVAEGAKVHLVGIDEAALEQAVQELGPDNASSSTADVTDEQAVHAAVEQGYTRYG